MAPNKALNSTLHIKSKREDRSRFTDKIETKSSIRSQFSEASAASTQSKLKSEQKVDKSMLWRVIAPYLTIIKKKEKEHLEEHDQFSFYLEKKPAVLLRDLSTFMSDSVEIPSLLYETSEVLKRVTKAAGGSLYLIDKFTNQIYLSTEKERDDRHKVKWFIEEGTTVAAYVAKVKDYILVEDILGDKRFPRGLGYDGDVIPKSVLCIPIVTTDGECFAIIELYRRVYDSAFTREDLKISVMVTAWMGVAIYQNEERLALKRLHELNEYLLNLIKSYFGDKVLMEKLMAEVVKFAKRALGAERFSYFLIDNESNELVGHLFDENDIEEDKKVKFRFGKERGIAGLVARTGVTVNIKDAYKDSRFNKDIDEKTGYITRSILCMPIKGAQDILGVVQVVNKKNGGTFTINDENLFQTFSLYCAIALNYTKIYMQINKMVHQNNIYQKLFHLQHKPCIHDYETFTQQAKIVIPSTFDEFSWYINSSKELSQRGPRYCLYIFFRLIDLSEINPDDMIRFILTTKNLYRDNPYHNFEHAFNVCHCMYTIILRNRSKFSKLEIKALLVSALCHDIDHVGYTNGFLAWINDDLAQLYDVSILENHHYQVTSMILQDYNIYPTLSESEKEMLLQEIRNAIMATDLSLYFVNKSALIKMLSKGIFNWENQNHKQIVKSIMMTSSDLSGQCKPFLTAKRITESLYREYYQQGDLEKKMGLCPLSILDRRKEYRIPEDQIQFLKVVVIPCVELLQQLFPNTSDLYSGAIALGKFWQEIVNARGQRVWRQDDSIVRK